MFVFIGNYKIAYAAIYTIPMIYVYHTFLMRLILFKNVNRATLDWDVEVTVLLQVMGRAASSPAHSVQMKNVTHHGAVHVSKYK